MKIAFVTPSLTMGGYEKVIIAYANELAMQGHDVDILCGHRRGELIAQVDSQVSILDFHARTRKFLLPLTKYLKNKKVDILYCGFRSYSCIGVLAKRLARAKTVVYATQHGFQKDARLERFIKGRILKNADRLTAVTEAVAEFESSELSIPVSKYYVLENPVIDRSVSIRQADHPWFHDEIPIIAVCSRMAWDKGIQHCIHILKEVNKASDVRMMVLGDGPEMQTCKDLAQENRLSDKIAFMGFVSTPMSYMKRCSLLLHTPIEEGFGNIIVEALEVNIPVCVTACSGPLSIIRNGKYGCNLGSSSDPNFVQKAAETVISVLEGRICFPELRRRADDFTVQKATDAFLNLYSVEQESS